MRFSLSLAFFAALWAPAKADVCFMVYQLADNNLEFSIREDNYEMTQSEAIKDPTLTSWIYYDHRNYGVSRFCDIKEPLKNVFNSDGSEITGSKIEGSQYMRWDHTLSKMVVDRTLEGEQNGDDPLVVSTFLETALTDCVAKGSTEFFLVFSSHGGGFDGFGGDENTRNRKLTQSNSNIVGAIKTALANVAGAPAMLDVIGFDACLMSAIGAADDYREVAPYMIASEATEPGHGWAYNELTDSGTALDLAKNAQATFLTSKQAQLTHQTPKTLAIIDLAKFETFFNDWEALSVEMEALLVAEDSDFFTQLSRTRAEARAYEGVLDEFDAKDPSALDVGSFMEILQNKCVPALGSPIRAALETALASYEEMFVQTGNGPGTPEGTGMHVTFPIRKQYLGDPMYYQDIVGLGGGEPPLQAPAWLSFLQLYYESKTPDAEGFTVCTLGIDVSKEPQPGQLLINPGVSNPTASGGHDIATEVSREVDDILVEFGVDLTPMMDSLPVLQRRRRAMATNADSGSSTYEPRPSRHRCARGSTTSRERRQLQASDYLILFGGDVKGQFDQAIYSGFWDRDFYFVKDDSGSFDVLYAFDNGQGSKEIPVIWVPPNEDGSPAIDSSDILEMSIGMTEEEFTNATGGEYGYVSFSTTESAVDGVVSSVALYTHNGISYSETPRVAGGSIIPVLYVEGTMGNILLDVVVGGFNATVVDWNNETTLTVNIVDADDALDQYGLELLIVDIIAYDDDVLVEDENDLSGVDFATFEIERDGTVSYYGDDPSDDPSGVGSFHGSAVGTLSAAFLLGLVLLFGMN